MSEKTVFISYRQNPIGRAFAGRISDSLKRHGYNVYIDVDNLKSGDWKDQILKEVERRHHFIAVLTPDSLLSCKNNSDMVRSEYEKAVLSNRNIVPVKEESQSFREIKATCPQVMRKLFDKQGLELRHSSFQSDVEKLIRNFLPPIVSSRENFANNFFTILVLLSAITVFNFGVNYRDWSFIPLLLISISLLMFRNIFSLPPEIKTYAYLSIFMIAFGLVILFEKIKSEIPIGDSIAIVGISILAFGIGLGTVVPKYRVS